MVDGIDFPTGTHTHQSTDLPSHTYIHTSEIDRSERNDGKYAQHTAITLHVLYLHYM